MKRRGFLMLRNNFTVNLALTLILLSFLVFIQQGGQKIFSNSNSIWHLNDGWQLDNVGLMSLSNSGQLSIYDENGIVTYDINGNLISEFTISLADRELLSYAKEAQRSYILPGEWAFRGDTLLYLTDKTKSKSESLIMLNQHGRKEFTFGQQIALAHLAESGTYVNVLGLDKNGRLLELTYFINRYGEIVWEAEHFDTTILALYGDAGGWATISWDRKQAQFIIDVYADEGLVGRTSLERLPTNFWLGSESNLWAFFSERNLHVGDADMNMSSINTATRSADFYGVYLTEDSVAIASYTDNIAGKRGLGLIFYSHNGNLLYSYLIDTMPLSVDTAGNSLFIVFENRIQIYNSGGRLVDDFKVDKPIIWTKTYDDGLVFVTSDRHVKSIRSE